jgi:hypothetical protein
MLFRCPNALNLYKASLNYTAQCLKASHIARGPASARHSGTLVEVVGKVRDGMCCDNVFWVVQFVHKYMKIADAAPAAALQLQVKLIGV